MLAHAGLGKRVMAIPEDGKHDEVIHLDMLQLLLYCT